MIVYLGLPFICIPCNLWVDDNHGGLAQSFKMNTTHAYIWQKFNPSYGIANAVK